MLNSMSGATVEQLAEAAGLDDPGDVVALLAMYGTDTPDLWEEDGVVSKAGVQEVHDVLNPSCVRTVPGVWGSAGDDPLLG